MPDILRQQQLKNQAAYDAAHPKETESVKSEVITDAPVESVTPVVEIPKQPTEAELSKTYTKLDTGEWVKKEYYDGLLPVWQTKLKTDGVDKFKAYWESKPYGGATEFMIGANPFNQSQKAIYGKTSNPNIGVEENGTRIYLGDRWPEQVIIYTGKPGAINTTMLLAMGDSLKPSDVTSPALIKQRDEDIAFIQKLAPKYEIDLSRMGRRNGKFRMVLKR